MSDRQWPAVHYNRIRRHGYYGQVTDSPSPRSYNIRTSNGVVRRNRTHLRIAAPPAHPTAIPTDIEVTNSATRYHSAPVPTPTTKPIDEAQANSQTDHEEVEPELTTPTKDSPPHASPKMIRLPATSPKVNVSSLLKQQDTRRQFYTRSGRESKTPKRYEQ